MFVLADCRGDSIGIETMGPTDSLSELVAILDDWVSALHDEPPRYCRQVLKPDLNVL